MEPEPRVQPKFRFAAPLLAIALFATVLAADRGFELMPNREAAPPAVAALRLDPIEISAAQLAPFAMVGAWQLTSSDPRVGGISGLALNAEVLVAITDAGAVLRFPKKLRRRMEVRVADLPSGPGDERFKENRDAEAISRDPQARGWWIAFENRDELWLYDPAFERALKRVAFPVEGLSLNTGIEGLAGGEDGILAFPEDGGSVLRWSGERWGQAPLDRRTAVSDAVQIDERSVLLLERRLTPTGFRNALALVDTEDAVFRTLWRKPLPVGRRDNVEAIAAERTPGGGLRLWMMSDDNFHPRMRTVLLVVDVPAALLPKRR